MANSVDICNSAFLMIGVEAIQSFDEDTLQSQVAEQLYEDTKELLLSEMPWRFSIAQASLSLTTETPKFSELQNVFQLPADFRRLVRTESNTSFRIYGDKLHSNQSSVNIEYQFMPTEPNFPAYFRRCLSHKLSILFAAALTDEGSKVDIMRELYDQQLKIAKSIDNQSTITDNINSNAFTIVRNQTIA